MAFEIRGKLCHRCAHFMNRITGVEFCFAYCTVAVTYVRAAQILFGVITSRRMRWARHVARTETVEINTGFCGET